MIRLTLVTTVLALFIAFYGLTSISPAKQKEGSPAKQKEDDLATQVKTLREEVRRLSARVSELEKQGHSLRTASQQAPPCDGAFPQVLLPAKIEWQIPVQGPHACNPLPAYEDAGTRCRIDFVPYPSPWDDDKCAPLRIDYAPFPSPSDYGDGPRPTRPTILCPICYGAMTRRASLPRGSTGGAYPHYGCRLHLRTRRCASNRSSCRVRSARLPPSNILRDLPRCYAQVAH